MPPIPPSRDRNLPPQPLITVTAQASSALEQWFGESLDDMIASMEDTSTPVLTPVSSPSSRKSVHFSGTAETATIVGSSIRRDGEDYKDEGEFRFSHLTLPQTPNQSPLPPNQRPPPLLNPPILLFFHLWTECLPFLSSSPICAHITV
jgi:hypothetical protein